MSNDDNLDMELASGIAAFEAKNFTTAYRFLAPFAEAGNPLDQLAGAAVVVEAHIQVETVTGKFGPQLIGGGPGHVFSDISRARGVLDELRAKAAQSDAAHPGAADPSADRAGSDGYQKEHR